MYINSATSSPAEASQEEKTLIPESYSPSEQTVLEGQLKAAQLKNFKRE